MNNTFILSFQSEWLKKKKSAASWLTWVGGFFVPVILLFARFTNFGEIAEANQSDQLWQLLYGKAWQFMGFFLLPMGVILATSLITQLEFRNNTWKQLHTTPQGLTTIYIAKLLVILLMLLQFFILFNVGVYLEGVVPALFFSSIPFPKQAFPWQLALEQSGKFMLACLPIVALQYLLGLQFKNFLVPLGAGLGLLIASLIAISWQYGYIVPYSYCAYIFLGLRTGVNKNPDLYYWILGYTVLLLIAGYLLYIFRKEKG